MKKKIQQALSTFDPSNDEQWTGDGLPRVEVVEDMLGEGVTRKQITNAAPEFTREHAATAGVAAAIFGADAGGDGADGDEPEDEPEDDGEDEPEDEGADEDDDPEGVLDRPMQEVLRTFEGASAAAEALNRRVLRRAAERRKLDEEIDGLNRKAQLAERAKQRLRDSGNAPPEPDPVREYLARQVQEREQMAATRPEQTNASGYRPAPIDQAMAPRRQGRSAMRPEPRKPAS